VAPKVRRRLERIAGGPFSDVVWIIQYQYDKLRMPKLVIAKCWDIHYQSLNRILIARGIYQKSERLCSCGCGGRLKPGRKDYLPNHSPAKRWKAAKFGCLPPLAWKPCAWCGQEMPVYDVASRRRKPQTCSVDCAGELRKTKVPAEAYARGQGSGKEDLKSWRSRICYRNDYRCQKYEACHLDGWEPVSEYEKNGKDPSCYIKGTVKRLP
jgi:hypothetical protein